MPFNTTVIIIRCYLRILHNESFEREEDNRTTFSSSHCPYSLRQVFPILFFEVMFFQLTQANETTFAQIY